MTTDLLWQAVAARDRRADPLFVYAVRSTGVYCRPSCPSRRPRRERVEFYPTPASARDGGYRACRRCRPDELTRADGADERVRRACEAVRRAPDAAWSAARLARASGGSVAQLQRAFRAALGVTPRDYLAACRRRRFQDELRTGADVTAATYAAGYGSPSRVYGAWQMPGMTPATYGRGGEGATIDWITGATPVGRVLVAATGRGVCFVEIGENDRALKAALDAAFPRAAIAPGPAARLAPWLETARAVAEARAVSPALPVDVRGTAFQWRVWRALAAIPRGGTRAYVEVARALGRPGASRAVARACATNPLALVVPCHRVVPASGDGPGGYRWGVAVKRALLNAERPKKTTSEIVDTHRVKDSRGG